MKKVIIMLTAVMAMVSCKENNSNGQVYVQSYTPSQNDVTVTPEMENLGDNLNLQALGELVKNSTSAQDIEDKLNSSGSINNLDLDNDGNVDYIKVTEYGDGNDRGFSFTIDLANGESQEIATIQIAKDSNQAQMNIQGNNQLYGNNNYYESRYSLSDLLIMNYLFTYHRPYYSPYHYGYYPSHYHSYRSVPSHSYSSRMKTTTTHTTITRTSRPSSSSKISSPNAHKSSNAVTARAKSISTPTRSQKSFSTTSSNNSRPKTSGFGSKKRNSSYSSSSHSSPSSSRGSSWGGSSSRSSSSGSSYRSSSSRSSGFGSSSRSSSRSRH